MANRSRLYTSRLNTSVRRWVTSYWSKSLWHKCVTVFVLLIVTLTSSMYGVAEWYVHSQTSKPLQLGVTFIPDYAEELGVDPKATMDALIGIGARHFRLVSYWNDIEANQGQYDFSQLDWQFAKATAARATVSLAVGLRQPRWPECHAPNWVDTSKAQSEWYPQLKQYMTAVVARYKDNPALKSYQLENEYYNHFGSCNNFDRARLSDELALVHSLDSTHPVIISRSNNYAGLSLKQPLPDLVGISVYRRVWDAQITHRYAEYPFPSWYYAFLAGAEKLATGKDSVLHELQTEPWPPNGKNITDISLAEQNKSFDAARFKEVVAFGKRTGLKHIDLWGGEYWYYRMQVLHDPSVWNVARQEFKAADGSH